MNDLKLRLKAAWGKFRVKLKNIQKFSFVAFLLFVAVIYGFVLLRAGSLSQTEPSSNAVTSQVKAAQLPHIDKKVVKQLESLQDNSVSVKALFDQARSNPFQ